MSNLAVVEKPIVNITSKKSKWIFLTSPGIDYSYFVISADLNDATLVDEGPIPDSFFQGLKDCEENQTVDLDTALNSPPPCS